ncbi:hypothetical protein ACTFIV_000561 [Dictyostelium citrinum]
MSLEDLFEDILNKYNETHSMVQIHLAYQIYVDLVFLKKWSKVEFKHNDKLIYLHAIENLNNPNNYNIVIPCKSTSIWSVESIKKMFNNLNDLPIDCKSFTLGIQDEDSSISYYELSFNTGLSDPIDSLI